MTTSSTFTTVSNSTSTTFQTWVNEIYNNLVTICGLTQTADTGQMAVPCVSALPGTSTMAGYYVFRFNDTLQATAPVFIKMEFGQGITATGDGSPSILVTAGAGTNGAGTITGLSFVRSAMSAGNTQISGTNTTNYQSRYCYNATQGFLGLVFKIGAIGSAGAAWGGLLLYRSVDNTGAPTATSVSAILNAYNTTSGTSSSNAAYCYWNNPIGSSGQTNINGPGSWANIPLSTGSSMTSQQGTTAQMFPVYQYAPTTTTPGWGITNAAGLVIAQEIPLNTTFTCNVIGALTLTYINVGTGPATGTITSTGFGVNNYGVAMLWQ